MTCFHPLEAYQLNGKGSLIFSLPQGADFRYQRVRVPCGQCLGCRLEHSRQWALRCCHEASLYTESCFITLTYNDKYLPKDGSLCKRHLQLFWKRFRKAYPDNHIRYYAVGEYGTLHARPHYHAIVFGFNFPDLTLHSYNRSTRCNLYRSQSLESLWSDPATGERYGFCTVGTVTFESCAYVSRYCMKKFKGRDSFKIYESLGVSPEWSCCSNRPGIGAGFVEKWINDIYPNDDLIFKKRNGEILHLRPPRYYDKLLERKDPQMFEELKRKRRQKAQQASESDQQTPERLLAREAVLAHRTKRLVRAFEEQDCDIISSEISRRTGFDLSRVSVALEKCLIAQNSSYDELE